MPSIPLAKHAKEFKQCQNCHETKADGQKALLTCGGCSRAHYCSKECQNKDWPNHKAMCKQNRAALAMIKEQSDSTVEGATLRDTESALKKWVQSYRPIISSSVIHALTLQTNPDLCFTHVLVIVLVPNTSFPNWWKSIPNSFLVDDVYTSSMDELTSMKPEWGPGFASLVERSKALRAKGGLGYALSIILVKGSSLAHMTPFGIDEMLDVNELPWNYRWEETLKDLVAQGKVV